MISFEVDARLVVLRSRRVPAIHHAAFGLLLNRVKRMRLRPSMQITITCGDRAYDRAGITELLDSKHYSEWLLAPRAQRPLRPSH